MVCPKDTHAESDRALSREDSIDYTRNNMQYVSSIKIPGPPESAVKVVCDALIANGFAIADANSTGVTATGPGLISSNQNAILGASRASFRTEGGVLHVQAELGGAAWLGRFAMFFPIGLGVLLVIIFGAMWWPQKPTAVVIPLIAVSPWLVIGPLMARSIRRKTERAIDALLQSAASMSRVG